MNNDKDKGVFCEYKLTNRKFDSKDFDDVLDSIKVFPSVKGYLIYIFIFSWCAEEVIEKSKGYNTVLIGFKELFQDNAVYEE